MTFPAGQSVSFLLKQKVWETRSQEEQLEGMRTRERSVTVLGYWQLSHLEELTLFWVSLASAT